MSTCTEYRFSKLCNNVENFETIYNSDLKYENHLSFRFGVILSNNIRRIKSQLDISYYNKDIKNYINYKNDITELFKLIYFNKYIYFIQKDKFHAHFYFPAHGYKDFNFYKNDLHKYKYVAFVDSIYLNYIDFLYKVHIYNMNLYVFKQVKDIDRSCYVIKFADNKIIKKSIKQEDIIYDYPARLFKQDNMFR